MNLPGWNAEKISNLTYVRIHYKFNFIYRIRTCFFFYINPPEAIQNLVTPVATPRSVRPFFLTPVVTPWSVRLGFFSNTFCTQMSKAIPRSHRPAFFNGSGHTTVCQTSFFFWYFRLGHQWPYHGLTDWVRGMVTDILRRKSYREKKQPGLWDCGMATDIKKTRSVRSRYGHWRKGWKTWTPKSVVHQNFRYWWRTDAAAVKIVTFRIAVNTMAQNRKGQIQLFNVWRRRQEKKSWIHPLPFHAIVFAVIQKVTILTPASILHQ